MGVRVWGLIKEKEQRKRKKSKRDRGISSSLMVCLEFLIHIHSVD